MAFVGAFLLLIVVVGGVGLLVAMVSAASLAVSRAAQLHSGETQKVCSRCGYPTRGLVTTACPECGADLKECAVHAKLRPRWGDTLRRRGMWTGVLVLLGCLMVVSVAFWWLGQSIMP